MHCKCVVKQLPVDGLSLDYFVYLKSNLANIKKGCGLERSSRPYKRIVLYSF
jgi:hypothetical protein